MGRAATLLPAWSGGGVVARLRGFLEVFRSWLSGQCLRVLFTA
nr:MAG TPA: hypothetical protein [Caudoviricetes sp.]